MQEREKIKELFDRYRKGQCTPEEQARLHEWFNYYARNEAHGLRGLRASKETQNEVDSADRVRRLSLIRRLLPYAAVVLLVLGGTLFLHLDKKTINGNLPNIINQQKKAVIPSQNKAMLILADGTTVGLSAMQNGVVVSADNITYNDGSESIVKLNKETISQLVLATPKGGTYQLTLSDGTKVWLNAGSTLRYPSQFAQNERAVEINGEGYFSVVKNPKSPFKVISRGQEVEVLGTEFNISAYDDDREVKTTLIEGSVKVSPISADGNSSQESQVNRILKPGQQSILTDNEIQINDVDTEPAIAWKDGLFIFNDEPLKNVMRRVARWYDVEVVYQGVDPNELYWGSVSRYDKVSKVLRKLELTGGVHFKIEGRTIIVTK